MQSAPKPYPGIEWVSGDFASKRLWSVLDDAGRRTAIDIHNSILTKFSAPTKDHWIYTMQFGIVNSTLADLEPLTQIPPADNDFWFRYLDSDDVAKWAAFFADSLPQMADGFESSLK